MWKDKEDKEEGNGTRKGRKKDRRKKREEFKRKGKMTIKEVARREESLTQKMREKDVEEQ